MISVSPSGQQGGRQGSRTLRTRRSPGLANRPGKPYPATFRSFQWTHPGVNSGTDAQRWSLRHARAASSPWKPRHAPKDLNPDQLGWNQPCCQLHQGRVLCLLAAEETNAARRCPTRTHKPGILLGHRRCEKARGEGIEPEGWCLSRSAKGTCRQGGRSGSRAGTSVMARQQATAASWTLGWKPNCQRSKFAQSTGRDLNPRRRMTGAVSLPLDDQCVHSGGPVGIEPSSRARQTGATPSPLPAQTEKARRLGDTGLFVSSRRLVGRVSQPPMAQGERIGRMTGKTRRAFLFANVTRPQDHHSPRLRQRAAPKPPVINCVPLLRRTRTASEGSQESLAHTLPDKTLEAAVLFSAAEKMSATRI